MFDFGQIVEKVTGLFEDGSQAQDLLGGSLQELIETANFDPSALENASLDQLSELLNQAGIDPSNLTDGQVLETAQDLFQSGVLENLDLSNIPGISQIR